MPSPLSAAGRRRARRACALLDALLEAPSVAVIACDEEGRMTHSSRGARELLGPLPASGASADAWLGELLPRTPEGLPLGLEDLPLTRTLRERIPRESAIRLLTPRGEELLLARAIPLLGEDGTTHLGAAVVLERDRP